MLLYSGRSIAAFQTVKNDLSVLESARFLGNDPGSASLYDIALLSGMYGLFSGFLHATALVKSEQGNTATEFTSLLIPWLSAITNNLGSLARQIDEGDYTSQGSSLAMQAHGMKTMYTASEEQGVSPETILPIKSLMESAVKNGHGDASLSALIEYFALGPRK
jgi:3-hydroxyisobutyrate dehydrogenase